MQVAPFLLTFPWGIPRRPKVTPSDSLQSSKRHPKSSQGTPKRHTEGTLGTPYIDTIPTAQGSIVDINASPHLHKWMRASHPPCSLWILATFDSSFCMHSCSAPLLQFKWATATTSQRDGVKHSFVKQDCWVHFQGGGDGSLEMGVYSDLMMRFWWGSDEDLMMRCWCTHPVMRFWWGPHDEACISLMPVHACILLLAGWLAAGWLLAGWLAACWLADWLAAGWLASC